MKQALDTINDVKSPAYYYTYVIITDEDAKEQRRSQFTYITNLQFGEKEMGHRSPILLEAVSVGRAREKIAITCLKSRGYSSSLLIRAFTAVELRKKLHGNNFTLDTIEAVINDFISSKGVSKFDAENAIKLVFEEGESDNDQKLVHGLSKLSMDNLLVQASKQWLRGQEVPKETRKSRIVHWLQYRGFSWDVSKWTCDLDLEDCEHCWKEKMSWNGISFPHIKF
ncbi:regulatory protein RecX family protein [Prunus dulcis]|uniref:Regulatory protein RecX family protein n=1 Tax=Prunus dulcis TaxID=3755 RepID=A0A4Y1RKF9_PRUDU|nr:regulatory protein RecX family protein [Prunus dulcis]